MPIQKLRQFFDENLVKYISIIHSKAYTSDRIAAIAHISGNELAKAVMLKKDGEHCMAVLPASKHVNRAAFAKKKTYTEDLAHRNFSLCRIRTIAVLAWGLTMVFTAASAQQGPARLAASPAQTRAAKMLAAMPLTFEKNIGQADDDVRFLARGDTYSLALSPTAVTFLLRQDRTHMATLHMSLRGSKPDAQVSGIDAIASKTNYLLAGIPPSGTPVCQTSKRSG